MLDTPPTPRRIRHERASKRALGENLILCVRHIRLQLWLGLLLGGVYLIPSPASAQVYRWVDDEGQVHYVLVREELPDRFTGISAVELEDRHEIDYPGQDRTPAPPVSMSVPDERAEPSVISMEVPDEGAIESVPETPPVHVSVPDETLEEPEHVDMAVPDELFVDPEEAGIEPDDEIPSVQSGPPGLTEPPIAKAELRPPTPSAPTPRIEPAPPENTLSSEDEKLSAVEQAIRELETLIEKDREEIRVLISQGRPTGEDLAADIRLREIAERLPRMQSELKALRGGASP